MPREAFLLRSLSDLRSSPPDALTGLLRGGSGSGVVGAGEAAAVSRRLSRDAAPASGLALPPAHLGLWRGGARAAATAALLCRLMLLALPLPLVVLLWLWRRARDAPTTPRLSTWRRHEKQYAGSCVSTTSRPSP